MNAIQLNQSQSTAPSFKTPLLPVRKGKKKEKSPMGRNYDLSHSTFLQDISIQQTINQSNDSPSSKSYNKRKTFKSATHFPNKHLILTPAVDMLYKISKRSLEVDPDDEVLNQPKRRKLKAGSVNKFKDDNYIRADDKHELSGEDILRLFDITDERKIPDQNENLLSSSNDVDANKLIEPVIMKHESVKDEQKLITSNVELTSLLPKHRKLDSSTEVKTEQIVNCEPLTIKQLCENDAQSNKPNKGKRLSDAMNMQFHTGQMLWARFSKYPYWPSIVCPSDTGIIQDNNQRVHVRFCANKGNSGWIKAYNVFDFDGIQSFIIKRKSMQEKVHSKSEKHDFQESFNIKKCKAWPKAVVEGTFLMSKALEVRHAFFNILFMISLCESKSLDLSKVISESSTCQVVGANDLLKENPNICEEIKDELAQLNNNLDLDELNSSLCKTPPRRAAQSQKTERPKSAPALLAAIDKRRKSIRKLIPLELSKSSVDLSTKKKPTKNQSVRPEQKILEKFRRQMDRQEEFYKDLTTYVMKTYPKNILFKDIRRGNTCKICFSERETGDTVLVKCSGTCGDYVHKMCVSNDEKNVNIGSQNPAFEMKTENFAKKKRKLDFRITTLLFCKECVDPLTPFCFVCKTASSSQSKLVRCNIKNCGRYYHILCLSDWLQTKFIENDKILCPAHVCHTCVSDDPQNKHYSTTSSQLTRCIKCPTTFHIDSGCIPAGSKLLTQSHHVCIRHRVEVRKPVNVNWCYICGETGGVVLCCDTCPQSSHFACLQLPAAPDRYICDSCETGRHPLYGEVVWAKLAKHRWWPAIVVPPFCIPEFLENIRHQDHDLCIRFFGSYEFAWIGRTYVYLYDQGDANKLSGDQKYDKAVIQAENWFNKLTVNKIGEDCNKTGSNRNKLMPKPFTTISNLRPLPPARLIKGENEAQRCNCSSNDLDPCGPMSNCANRACLTECDAELCPCGVACNNQCIQKKIYAPFHLTYMGEKGFGLLAEKPIKAGNLVIEYIGELVTEEEFQRRRKTKQSHNFYFMKYMKGLYIDAELKGNYSRFLNHSCNPNCEPQVWSVNGVNRIGLFALFDIPKGTELTFNYEFDDDTHKCYCGESNCKGFIGKKSS